VLTETLVCTWLAEILTAVSHRC